VEFDVPQDQYILGHFSRSIDISALLHVKALTFKNRWYLQPPDQSDGTTPADAGCSLYWGPAEDHPSNDQFTDLIYAFRSFVRAAVRAVPKQQLQTFR
jgi:hypothetical protein